MTRPQHPAARTLAPRTMPATPLMTVKIECARMLVEHGVRDEHAALRIADRVVEAVLRGLEGKAGART